MSTYLLTWVPKRTPRSWEKEAADTARGVVYREGWSTGVRKNMQPDDRLFLLKQGTGQKGIMGSGRATSEVYPDKHWDPVRRSAGDKALYVDVDFDRILDPASDTIISLSVLEKRALAEVNWNTQASGISLDVVAEELERLWRSHLLDLDYVDPNDEAFSAIEGELRQAMQRHRKREGLPRKKKSSKCPRRRCLECQVPGSWLRLLRGLREIGRHFAHVHHLLQLGVRETPSPTRLTDLAIVCPNCHAMIHRGGGTGPSRGSSSISILPAMTGYSGSTSRFLARRGEPATK